MDFAFEPFLPLLDAVRQLQMGLLRELYLHGNAKSGKSHFLAAITHAFTEQNTSAMLLPMRELAHANPDILDGIEQFDAVLLDDVDTIFNDSDWQEALFHLINRGRERGCRFVFSAYTSPNGARMLDLKTRLSQATRYHLPDDLMLNARATWLSLYLQRRALIFDSAIIDALLSQNLPIHAMANIIDTLTPLFAKQKKLTKKSLVQAQKIIASVKKT